MRNGCALEISHGQARLPKLWHINTQFQILFGKLFGGMQPWEKEEKSRQLSRLRDSAERKQAPVLFP